MYGGASERGWNQWSGRWAKSHLEYPCWIYAFNNPSHRRGGCFKPPAVQKVGSFESMLLRDSIESKCWLWVKAFDLKAFLVASFDGNFQCYTTLAFYWRHEKIQNTSFFHMDSRIKKKCVFFVTNTICIFKYEVILSYLICIWLQKYASHQFPCGQLFIDTNTVFSGHIL